MYDDNEYVLRGKVAGEERQLQDNKVFVRLHAPYWSEQDLGMPNASMSSGRYNPTGFLRRISPADRARRESCGAG